MTDEAIGVACYSTEEGKAWLQEASLEELVGRQAFLLFHNRPITLEAYEEYDLIESVIRGQTVEELCADRARFAALSAQLNAEVTAGAVDRADCLQWWRERWEAPL